MVYDLSKSDNSSIEFFANLRLHNRLDKRLVKHKDGTTEQNSEWKYSNSTTVTITHRITEGSRKEEVKFKELGTASYETIYSSALLSMKDLEELPEVFVKGVTQLSTNAASLHYLLFGTEVIRNPSALIHNMMILDLIKCGKLTWKQAFLDHHMSMSITGAIMASRIKNSEYNDEYMPHKYLYEDKTYKEYANRWNGNWDKTNYESAVDLLNREKKIMIEWLEMKFGQDYLKFCLDEKGDLKIEHVESIFSLLEKTCQNWYNIDISELTQSVSNLSINQNEKPLLSGESSNIEED